MTIAETFNFYGRVFGMRWSQIQDRGLELLKFLDLPESDKFVGQLRYSVRVCLVLCTVRHRVSMVKHEPNLSKSEIEIS